MTKKERYLFIGDIKLKLNKLFRIIRSLWKH